ncbi:DUF624 domain-containing protein [Alkalihalobacillus hemicellulosilyticus]|uniref:DUF624 domain-containing protein n=1 Tax=Halalkalibacter hemicellulosilyticus TaxID=127886 RepID=UPI0006906722|nr:DUF624 domain-containing protein [Halalkalibacter hemicellulosilyticus]
MNGNQIVSSLDRILRWILQLVAINLLWLFYSMLGLFIVGVFPATLAAFGLSRKLIMEQDDVKKERRLNEFTEKSSFVLT